MRVSSKFGRLLAIATVAFLMWVVRRWADTPDEAPPTQPESQDSAAPQEGFFALPESEQLAGIVAQIVQHGACRELFEEARRVGRTGHLLTLLVRLAGLKDPAMMQHAADRLTTFEPGQEPRTTFENQRIDDSAFKENLLYEIRDNLPPESPLLLQLFDAYRAEPDTMTRMRIVRAIGKVGGARARALLSMVEDEERGSPSPAATEARKYLRR